MKLLVFDTETNGLPKNINDSIFNSSSFPHMLQLSYILYETDNYTIIKSSNKYIKNVTNNEDSFKINKISQTMIDNGNDIKSVLLDFINTIKLCDMIVAHNYKFDKRIIMAECARHNLFYKLNFNIKNKKYYCTMLETIEICKIPSMYNNNSYKYPKLIELHEKLFNEPINQNLHNSFVDSIFTLKCFIKLIYNTDILSVTNEFNYLLENV